MTKLPPPVNDAAPSPLPRWKAPDEETKSAIRKILGFRKDAPWIKCPAKDLRRVSQLESQGDFTHRDKDHEPCPKCRCTKTCGSGTRGDFYGLGETGHFGVGYCAHHEGGIRRQAAYQYAMNHKDALQQSGRVELPAQIEDQMVQKDAQAAERRIEVRRELSLVHDTLQEFLELTKQGTMTERGRVGPGPISDKSRIETALAIANTLSKLNLDQFKMQQSEYLHIDELKVRIPQMMQMTERAFEQLFEWLVCGKENALALVKQQWRDELKNIWMKRGN